MVTTPQAPPTKLAEQRIVMHNVDWQTYQNFLATLADRSSPRLAYYHGTLEIMAPLEEHENKSGLIGKFVEILTEELELNLKTMQSTTLDREDLNVGAEPDKCYYIANEPLVRGKTGIAE